ncbi:hypothetical protein BDQ12DRAFT_724615 [Crucibulum laeve]|uniref:GYF domain-containing protein n=1 Tax=Crucibulum laeve TaxID=68775 RepID=A0A5C3LUX2_9AGAR|nr:hypothetical protein BDQ12DRAFT_724615 [Crucibulum laeve]
MSTTMHFGPEWMRTKHQPHPRSSQHPPSPPPTNPPLSATSTYSALVSAPPPVPFEKDDDAHPFRYSKEEMLRIYKEGAGKGGLGLEVERWEGVVRELGSDPVGIHDLSEAEKKLFAGPLNSDLRRRQSTDYLSPLNTNSLGGERPRLNHNSSSATGSPLRERFGALKRRDTGDPPSLTIPRKQSLSNLQAPMMSPRDGGQPSPRTRGGYTPGFDGVLSSGESWVARRRASEASLKAGASAREGGEHHEEKVIREEKEEEEISGPHPTVKSSRISPSPGSQQLQPDNQQSGDFSETVRGTNIEQFPGNNIAETLPGGLRNVGPPPGLQDLASIEWSYKDPSGQVQGPFRADLMQKWYDDGYFTPDLPMKRTHLDTQWISVEELGQRAGNNKIFLTPAGPVLPPGLSRRDSSPMQNYGPPLEQTPFSGPFQPAPIRTLRSSTLDSYVSNGSNSSSPSSSFAAARFGESPEPAVYSGRLAPNTYFPVDPSMRNTGFPGGPDLSSHYSARRGPFNDTTLGADMRYNNFLPGRGQAMDGFGFNGQYSPIQTPWNGQNIAGGFEPVESGFSTFGHGNSIAPGGLNQSVAYNGMAGVHGGIRDDAPASSYQDANYGIVNSTGLPSANPVAGDNSYNTFAGVTAQEQQYMPSHHQELNTAQSLQQPSSAPFQSQPLPQSANDIPVPPVPWSTVPEVSSSSRPGPFEVGHPTAANTITIPPTVPSQPSPWGRTSQSSKQDSQANEPSAWVAASQGVVEDGWKSQPGPNSLTVSNVGQHNQQQEQLAAEGADEVEVVNFEVVNVEEGIEEQLPTVFAPTSEAPPPQKSTKKTKLPLSAEEKQASVPKQAMPTPSAETPTPPSVPKAPWAKEDDLKKTKAGGISVSLREIQEAEAKKAEVRKAAERERERAARTATAIITEQKDDSQPFTASWGLPTSQAGVRGTTPAKDIASPVATPTVAPVWTTTAKTPVTKKTPTMKEILEEEERRKRIATKETVAAAASRRTYTESTNKEKAGAVLTVGNAWTTVGANGKTGTIASPVRPSPISSASTSTIPAASVPRPTAVVPAIRPAAVVTIPKPAALRTEEQATSPSHEFLKWLNDSLKGLNTSVNVEEIMSMLLSFPLDPDSSTSEIISDLIYANSTTLDGRRFATEFVSKRKADAVNRAKSASAAGKAAAKPVSIADVVKAAPKATQPEWGFKVVHKKKKGARV